MAAAADLGSVVERHAGSSPVPPTIPYHEGRVTGPYTLPSGRRHVTYYPPTGGRINIAYARYRKELELGRYLAIDEIVHHIDEDFTNDELSNLEVKNTVQHKKDHKRVNSETRPCLGCGVGIFLEGRRLSSLKSELKRGKAGPWCSSCRPVNQYAKH